MIDGIFDDGGVPDNLEENPLTAKSIATQDIKKGFLETEPDPSLEDIINNLDARVLSSVQLNTDNSTLYAEIVSSYSPQTKAQIHQVQKIVPFYSMAHNVQNGATTFYLGELPNDRIKRLQSTDIPRRESETDGFVVYAIEDNKTGNSVFFTYAQERLRTEGETFVEMSLNNILDDYSLNKEGDNYTVVIPPDAGPNVFDRINNNIAELLKKHNEEKEKGKFVEHSENYRIARDSNTLSIELGDSSDSIGITYIQGLPNDFEEFIALSLDGVGLSSNEEGGIKELGGDKYSVVLPAQVPETVFQDIRDNIENILNDYKGLEAKGDLVNFYDGHAIVQGNNFLSVKFGKGGVAYTRQDDDFDYMKKS